MVMLLVQIKDNTWIVYPSKEFKIGNNAQSIEIVDKYNRVLISASFTSTNTLKIRGYYVKSDDVVVINDGEVLLSKQKDGEKAILDSIDKIPHLFNYP
jgi:hypothetical protein